MIAVDINIPGRYPVSELLPASHVFFQPDSSTVVAFATWGLHGPFCYTMHHSSFARYVIQIVTFRLSLLLAEIAGVFLSFTKPHARSPKPGFKKNLTRYVNHVFLLKCYMNHIMVKILSQNKNRRKQLMLELLQETEIIQLPLLAKELGISEMTARRYVSELEPLVSLAGSHVFLRKNSNQEKLDIYKMDIETDRNIDKKKAVGKAAASLIEENDVVFIDCGTTTPFIAQHIGKGLKFKAICCSLNIFNILKRYEKSQILLTGGTYHEQTQVFSSRQALDMIRDIRLTKAFISAAGVDRKLGLTCFNQYETDLKREVMKYSQHVYLVIDSSKLNEVKMAYFGDIAEAHTIITDTDISPADEQWIRELGLGLVKN